MSDKSVLSDANLREIYDSKGCHDAGLRAVAEAAIAADRAARAEPVAVHQFRKAHCADWYDGLPDNEDGRGPYEERTLYTAPPAAPVVPEDVAKDAERYRWLKSRMIGVDFDWSEQGITALSFEMPDGCAFGGNCDQNIEAAMLAAAPAPSQEPKP